MRPMGPNWDPEKENLTARMRKRQEVVARLEAEDWA